MTTASVAVSQDEHEQRSQDTQKWCEQTALDCVLQDAFTNVKEPAHHLGGNFCCNEDSAFCCGAQTCVKHSCDNSKMMFGAPPAEAHASVGKDDKPEFGDLAELGPSRVQKFQSVGGAAQWLIALC